MSKHWYLFCVSLTLLATAPALAQEQGEEMMMEDDSADSDEQARVLYLRGDRLYSEGQYEEATAAFQQSYELSGRPALLFNLANAYERLGRLEEALQALQRFAPDAPAHQQATVNTRIANIEERLRAQDEERRAQEEAQEEGATPVAAPQSPVQPEPSSAARPVGIALVAIGAAAAGGGLAAALLARSSRSDIDDACMNGLCPATASDDLDAEKRRALAADILLFGGGALVVGGIIALIVGRPSSEDRARLEVSPTQGGVNTTLTTHF